MRKLFALVLFVTACGSSSTTDKAVGEAEGFKTKMCACADNDRACADKVSTEFRAWRKTMKAQVTKDDEKNMSPEQKQKMTATLEAMETCAGKARGGVASPKVSEMLAKMGEFKDRMCACGDQACVDATQKALAMWTAGQMHDASRFKLTDDDQKKLNAVAGQIAECGKPNAK